MADSRSLVTTRRHVKRQIKVTYCRQKRRPLLETRPQLCVVGVALAPGPS